MAASSASVDPHHAARTSFDGTTVALVSYSVGIQSEEVKSKKWTKTGGKLEKLRSDVQKIFRNQQGVKEEQPAPIKEVHRPAIKREPPPVIKNELRPPVKREHHSPLEKQQQPVIKEEQFPSTKEEQHPVCDEPVIHLSFDPPLCIQKMETTVLHGRSAKWR